MLASSCSSASPHSGSTKPVSCQWRTQAVHPTPISFAQTFTTIPRSLSSAPKPPASPSVSLSEQAPVDISLVLSSAAAMPDLVRERLYFGDIKDAIAALTGSSTTAFTHVLSIVSSASISYFTTDCGSGIAIPTEEVRRVVPGEDGAPPAAAVPPGTLMRVVERAGDGLRVTRMAVPLRDAEEENLLDHLEPEPCLDFIDDGRKAGNVLVHCLAGVSRSSSIIVAYLMRSEQKSLEGLNSLFLE